MVGWGPNHYTVPLPLVHLDCVVADVIGEEVDGGPIKFKIFQIEIE